MGGVPSGGKKRWGEKVKKFGKSKEMCNMRIWWEESDSGDGDRREEGKVEEKREKWKK